MSCLLTHSVIVILLATFDASPSPQPEVTQDEERPSPKLGTIQYALQLGLGLLQEQEWEQAEEAYGRWTHVLEEGVRKAWDSHADRPRKERHRFHFQLANFLVRHGKISLDHLEDIAIEYSTWVRSVSPEERGQSLDFSHADLLVWIRTQDHDQHISLAEQQRVLDALESNPDSIPALYALRWVHGVLRRCDEEDEFFSKAEEILQTPLSRLALARIAAGRLDTEFTTEYQVILREEWSRGQTSHEQALLLFGLGRKLLRRAGADEASRDEALDHLEQVYQVYPRTYWAAEARRIAIPKLFGRDWPNGILQEVRRLQGKGEEHKPGLDSVMRGIASRMEWESQARVVENPLREIVLLEIVREYPDSSAAGYAMFGLSQIEAKRGNNAREIEWLRKCSELERPHPPAMKPLAEWYEEQKEWKRALSCWGKYREADGCGNAMEAEAIRKTQAAARCYRELGDFSSIVRVYVRSLTGRCIVGPDQWKDFVPKLVRLYRDARQLDDLRNIVDQIEAIHGKTHGGTLACTQIPYIRKLIMEIKEGGTSLNMPENVNKHRPGRGSLPTELPIPRALE
ncbi:MAG: hypothetical protein O6952_08415 [Planctomycetota bacterium]|nr:hypothetical protein [Planctomycetota bacterium]